MEHHFCVSCGHPIGESQCILIDGATYHSSPEICRIMQDEWDDAMGKPIADGIVSRQRGYTQ